MWRPRWLWAAFLLPCVHVCLSFYCDRVSPQTDFDLDKMLGEWYLQEIVEHSTPLPNSVPLMLNHCPKVRLRRAPDGEELRLDWTEPGGDLTYYLRPNHQRPGDWVNSHPQNGSLAEGGTFSQFSGSILVLKAVDSHLVVTFCPRGPKQSPWSLVVSRVQYLPRDDLDIAERTFQYRSMPVGTIKRTCPHSGADAPAASFAILLAFLVLAHAHLS